MSTRLLILRHALTSAPEIFHGAESDVGLGELGHEQAREAAPLLARERPSAVYASPMRRARETAEPIASASGRPLQIAPALFECGMGRLSGTLWEETRPAYEAVVARWMAGDIDVRFEGGESYRQVRDRVAPAVLAIADEHPGECVVLVAHGLVNRVLMTSVVENSDVSQFEQIQIGHVQVHELRRSGNVELFDLSVDHGS